MSADGDVLLERHGALAIVTLNRPERRNGLTVAMCSSMYDTVQDVAASDARVLVLRGAGSDFCVGADIGAPRGGRIPTLADLGQIHHAATLLHTMPQVTIAAIDGGCAGAGFGYAAACDLRFAAAEARFNTAFLDVGVSGDMGLVWSLTRILGGAKARDLLLRPAKFDGTAAEAIGLVSQLFARETLHAEVRDIAEALLARDPFALRMMKANCLSAERLDIAEYIDLETARHVHCTNAPDFAERMAQGHARTRRG